MVARAEYISAIPLWYLTGAIASVACVYIGAGIYAITQWEYDPVVETWPSPGPVLLGGSLLLGAAVLMIPALVLTIDSYKKLNGIVDNYNSSKPSLYLGFGQTDRGVGMTLKF